MANVEQHMQEGHISEQNELQVLETENDESNKIFADFVEVQVGEQDGQIKPEIQWGEPDTALLFEKFNKYVSMVGPMKRYKTKKLMWKQISMEIRSELGVMRSDVQCENRYKTILKRKRLPYEHAIQTVIIKQQPSVIRRPKQKVKILAKHPQLLREFSVIPELQDDSYSYYVVSESEQEPEEPQKKEEPQAKKRGRSVQETLLLIHQLKEENRERRHQEKMEIMQKLLSILRK